MTAREGKPLIQKLIPWTIALSVLLFAVDGKLWIDHQHKVAADMAAARALG